MTKIIVITHVLYKDNTPIAGPYTSVLNALRKNPNNTIQTIRIPLVGYPQGIFYGGLDKESVIPVPMFLGKIAPIKYLVDFFGTLLVLFDLVMQIKNPKELVVIGMDPLSTMPALLLKQFLPYKLVFYCLDFNDRRFENYIMHVLYQKFDEWCSRYADQTWAVCQALIDYKKEHYGTKTIYIPNSFPFDGSYYEKGKANRTGKRVVWTGSALTIKQIGNDIVRVAKEMQEIRPDLEFWFIPSRNVDEFRDAIKKLGLNNATIHDVVGQEASRNLVSQCDVGLAIYDKDFGSTKYIEPIKIWEYMMCGVPFIISGEPSVWKETTESGVCLQLEPDNRLPNSEKIRAFLASDNLKSLEGKCLELAQKYSAVKTTGEALEKLKG